MKKLANSLSAALLAMTAVSCGHNRSRDQHDGMQANDPASVLFARALHEMTNQDYEGGLDMLHILINSYPESQYCGRAKAELENCSRDEKCATVRALTEALPPGGGMIFFPALKQLKKKTTGPF